MLRICLLGVVVAALGLVAKPGQAAPGRHSGGIWERYNNPVQGVSGCYPAGVFTAVEQPASSEPEDFMGRDGAGAEMYEISDGTGESLRREMADEEENEFGFGGQAVFQMVRPGFYLFVGDADGQVVYEKAILSGGSFKTFRMVYPKAEQGFYEPLVRRMATCFQAG